MTRVVEARAATVIARRSGEAIHIAVVGFARRFIEKAKPRRKLGVFVLRVPGAAQHERGAPQNRPDLACHASRKRSIQLSVALR